MPKFNNEVLIARATVISDKKILLPTRYYRLFQASHIYPGATTIRFPIKDMALSADLTAFQKEFPLVELKIDSNAIEEY